MAGFSEVFGFEPSQDPIVREAQQLVIDARLTNIAHRVTTARRTAEDLVRLLGKNISTSTAVRSFAGGMELVETEATAAETLLDEASKVAKAVGFAARGEVEDLEVERIFGLKAFHRPLTVPETSQVNDVLKALAAAFQLACWDEEKKRAGRDIQAHNAAMAGLESSKQMFWGAIDCARGIGVKVEREVRNYLRYELCSIYPFEALQTVVNEAKRQGLIQS